MVLTGTLRRYAQMAQVLCNEDDLSSAQTERAMGSILADGTPNASTSASMSDIYSWRQVQRSQLPPPLPLSSSADDVNIAGSQSARGAGSGGKVGVRKKRIALQLHRLNEVRPFLKGRSRL